MGIGKGGHPERRDDQLSGRTKRRELPHRRRRESADVREGALQKRCQLAGRSRVVPSPQRQCAFALLVLENLLGIAGHRKKDGNPSSLQSRRNRQERTEESRPMASRTFSSELNAEMRMKPSPACPKPAPGVVTTFASLSSLSKKAQESPLTFTQR